MTERISFDFSDLDVVVTGASSGIGAATARAFIQSGANVTGTGTRATPERYPDIPDAIRYLSLNLKSPESIRAFTDAIDKVDILVNNAGMSDIHQPFEEAIQVNLISVYSICTALKEKLSLSSLQGGASIVNIASLLSTFAYISLAGYGAAKSGIVNLTKSLAEGWAPDNIRVNAVAPGNVHSVMTKKFEADDMANQHVINKTPQARWAEPEEIAYPILFLCSPGASYITGATLLADGGGSIRF